MFIYLMVAMATGIGFGEVSEAANLRFTNEEGQPVVGATVRLGPLHSPIHQAETNLYGDIEIPSDWSTTLTINVEAKGYVSTVYQGQEPIDQTLILNFNDSRTPHEINGQANGMTNIRRDGKIDFGIAFPALRRRQLVHFDVSSVVSPDTDTVSIVGQDVHFPSNLTLPNQSENYIVPITLDKPHYRTFIGRSGPYRMIALHGQFPLRQVVNDFRNGKTFFDVINHFRFKSGGQRDIVVDQAMADQDISVGQIPFETKISTTAPQIPADTEVISFALVDQAGLFFPTDLKRVLPGQTETLVVPAGSQSNYVVSVLVRKSDFSTTNTVFRTEDLAPQDAFKDFMEELTSDDPSDPSDNLGNAVSVTLTGPNNETPIFLDHIKSPVIHKTHLELDTPRAIPGILPTATYVILSEIESTPKGVYGADKRYRILEIYQKGWTRELSLPNSIYQLDPAKKYRWEVLFLGRQLGQNEGHVESLETTTHVTRNALDF